MRVSFVLSPRHRCTHLNAPTLHRLCTLSTELLLSVAVPKLWSFQALFPVFLAALAHWRPPGMRRRRRRQHNTTAAAAEAASAAAAAAPERVGNLCRGPKSCWGASERPALAVSLTTQLYCCVRERERGFPQGSALGPKVHVRRRLPSYSNNRGRRRRPMHARSLAGAWRRATSDVRAFQTQDQ